MLRGERHLQSSMRVSHSRYVAGPRWWAYAVSTTAACTGCLVACQTNGTKLMHAPQIDVLLMPFWLVCCTGNAQLIWPVTKCGMSNVLVRAAFQDALLVLFQLLILSTDGTWHGCCAVLCCAVPCCAVLCCAVLCCAACCRPELAVIIPMHLSLKHIPCLLLYQSEL